jgi:hypothetical protein
VRRRAGLPCRGNGRFPDSYAECGGRVFCGAGWKTRNAGSQRRVGGPGTGGRGRWVTVAAGAQQVKAYRPWALRWWSPSDDGWAASALSARSPGRAAGQGGIGGAVIPQHHGVEHQSERAELACPSPPGTGWPARSCATGRIRGSGSWPFHPARQSWSLRGGMEAGCRHPFRTAGWHPWRRYAPRLP